MRNNKGFVMRKLGDEYVVVPVGVTLGEFNGMIRLNETGAFLWERLQNGSTREQLIRALLEEYEIDEEKAVSDTEGFIRTLKEAEILEL